jgi:uncharacterized protein (DUF2249 family)
MPRAKTVEPAVRPVPVREKHPTILRTFDGLIAGGVIHWVSNHDPKPLYYTFAAERAGQFQWTYLEQGPDVWRVEIRKAA